MNTHAEYRRHMHHHQPETTERPDAAEEGIGRQLARHGDPSLQSTDVTTPTGKRIAWVRPTDLHAYAGPTIGRGIDLQAELARRARRTPRTATRAARHLVRDLTHPSPSASAAQEGIQL